MPKTSAYALRVNTRSADENGVLLLIDGRLVAVIVELSDPVHEDRVGQWCVEAVFGVPLTRIPTYFPSLAAAVQWVSQRAGGEPGFAPEGLPRLD